MNEILQFKVKDKRKKEVDKFIQQIDLLKELYLRGDLDKIVILADGNNGKGCTSNGLYLKDVREMFIDFQNNYKEYINEQ